MKATTRFALICLGWIFAGLAAVWAVKDAGISELSTHGIVALGIGVVLTVGLAVALMTLTFYSGKREAEEAVPAPLARSETSAAAD